MLLQRIFKILIQDGDNMTVRHMKGVFAHLEDVRPTDYHHRNKNRCRFFSHEDSLCRCEKCGVFMCKCSTSMYCGYYVESKKEKKKEEDESYWIIVK